MAAIGTAQSSARRVVSRTPTFSTGSSIGGRPPTRSSRVSCTSWAAVICTGSSRSPMRRAWASVTIWRIRLAPAVVRTTASTVASSCSTGTPSVVAVACAAVVVIWARIASSFSTTRARSPLRWVSNATRWRYQPPAASARHTAATKNNKPARPRRTGEVSRICAVSCDRVADRARPGPPVAARGCCGGVCAGDARGAAGGVRSSPVGSPSRRRVARAASAGTAATRASSSGRWRSARSSASACSLVGLGVGVVVTWPDIAVVPLLIILGVVRRHPARRGVPGELHGVAGGRPGDAPAGAGRRLAAASLTCWFGDAGRTSVRWLHWCHSPPLEVAPTATTSSRSRCDTPSVRSPPSGRTIRHTTGSRTPERQRT